MKTKNIFLAIIISAVFFVLTTSANAGVPHLINYQGKLTKADGTGYAVGEYNFSVSIYDHPTGGSLVWGPQMFDGNSGTGHGASVPVIYGHFNVILGPTDTSSRDIATAFASANTYLEIKVNNDPPITPRQQILSAPYAVNSENAQNAVTAGTASTVVDNAITGSKIAGNAVTSSKIQNGSVSGTDIANGTITGADIQNSSIGVEKLNKNVITDMCLCPRNDANHGCGCCSGSGWIELGYWDMSLMAVRGRTCVDCDFGTIGGNWMNTLCIRR